MKMGLVKKKPSKVSNEKLRTALELEADLKVYECWHSGRCIQNTAMPLYPN